jgi:hypothetical protein
MAKHKVTLNFGSATALGVGAAPATAGSVAGWTESWYQSADLSDDAAQAGALKLALYRRGMLTPGWAIQSIRISQLDANANLLRRGRLVFVPPQVAAGFYPGAAQDEPAYDALILSTSSTTGHARHTGIRGIPEEAVSPGGRYLNPPAFAAAFLPWSNVLRGQPAFVGDVAGPVFGLRVRQQADGGNIAAVSLAVDIVGGITASPRTPVFTFTGGNGTMAVGQTVSIAGVQGFDHVNGSWIIAAFTEIAGSGKFVVAPKRRVTVNGSLTVAGTFKTFVYAIDPIATITPEYGSSRRTGRPPQLVRGRRSARR